MGKLLPVGAAGKRGSPLQSQPPSTGLPFLELADITGNRHEMALQVRTMTTNRFLEAASRAQKIVSDCQAVDRSEAFRPFFRDPSWGCGDVHCFSFHCSSFNIFLIKKKE